MANPTYDDKIEAMIAKLEQDLAEYRLAKLADECANDASSLLDDSPTDAVVHTTGDGCRYCPDDPDELVDDDARDIVTKGTIGDIARLVNSIALNSGWWNKYEDHGFETTINGAAEKLLMTHTEISEAVEDLRVAMSDDQLMSIHYDDDGKPYGFATELADIIIRTLDLAEWLGVDIEDVLTRKISFNATRPFRHGNKSL